MADSIIIAVLVIIVCLALRSIFGKRRKGQCAGGCTGCAGGCAGCAADCGRDREKTPQA